MSVVRRQTRRRWGAVTVLIAALIGGPALLSAARTELGAPATTDGEPEEHLARALAATETPHRAVAETRGTLGLPDLPGLGAVAGLLGGTTRSRVWWSGPQAWRVDTLTNTGEIGDYGTPGGMVTWDYEADELTTITGTPQVRLPRTVDLLPPQVVRRFLRHLAPDDTVSALPARLVAGSPATGLRVRTGDERGSVSAVELWTHPGGLPVEVRILDRAGRPALTSRYLELDLTRPPAALITPPDPPGTRRSLTRSPDVASRIQAMSVWRLPRSLAGLPSSTSLAAGAATYGRGLVRLVVVPVPPFIAYRLQGDARAAGGAPVRVTGGEAVLLGSAVVNAVAVIDADGDRSYVIAGLVTPDLLREAAGALLENPPPRLWE